MRRLVLLFAAALTLCAAPAYADVQVDAQISRRQLTVGESTTLDVTVRGAGGNVPEPEFDVPPGVEILGSSRQQSFSWVNGKSSSQVLFRYDLGPSATGTFRIGPFRVKSGRNTYTAPAVTMSVTAAEARIGRSGSGPAELRVDVSPARPYVGQPVLLRVRLIQRASLAEDPHYAPPSTPGFWSEDPSPPESFYADEGGQRVLVTETRTRMYPIASGKATIGPAAASVALSVPGAAVDPLQWLRGQVPRRQVSLQSRPVEVDVRPLPAGAPDGFSGAVGTLTATWSADRRETRSDVPITLRLDLRGLGNLPLVQAPRLDSDDWEIFTNTVDDSMPGPGRLDSARRRFMWTALPKHEGRLVMPAPAFAWFDPERGRYERLSAADVAVEVKPPLAGGPRAELKLPRELGERALDPFRRPALPWTWALGGLALGAAVFIWRRSTRPDPTAPDRARQREWLRVVGLAHGPDFWRAAEESTAWVQARGMDVEHLRREIASARYGGSSTNAESVRRRVIEMLGRAMPPVRPRWPMQVTAVLVALAAIVLCALTGPRGGGTPGIVRAEGADKAAAEGRIDEARSAWMGLWREGARAPGLAARLAWSYVSRGDVGPAALWVLRGEAAGGREPALAWIREQVREGGGLSGEDPAHLPVRPIEWAVLALIAGFIAGAWADRRALAVGGLALALVFALVRPAETAWQARTPRGVIGADTTLSGPGLDLEAGHVVRVLGAEGRNLRVSAGHGVTGTVPAASVLRLEGPA